MTDNDIRDQILQEQHAMIVKLMRDLKDLVDLQRFSDALELSEVINNITNSYATIWTTHYTDRNWSVE